MTRGICCAVAVAVMGCMSGGDEPTLQEQLIGTWALERADGCAVAFVFEGNGIFEADLLCELNTGEIGLEAFVGSYEVDGDRLELRVEASTCPEQGGDDEPGDARIDFTAGGDLRLITPSTAIVLRRVPEGGSTDRGLVILFGCYEDDGTFNEREIREF